MGSIKYLIIIFVILGVGITFYSLSNPEYPRVSELSDHTKDKIYETTPMSKLTPIEQHNFREESDKVRDVFRENHPNILFNAIPDQTIGAIQLGFESYEIADKYISYLDSLLDVPYYIVISNYTDLVFNTKF